MIIYPDIGLMAGRLVTLRRGQLDRPVFHPQQPLAAARALVGEGAECLNVIDYDAVARAGRSNAGLVSRLIREVPVPVQVGGGIDTIADVASWIDRGADSVVIGSAARADPGLVRAACAAFPFRVLLAIDVRRGEVMGDGWRRSTGLSALEFARRFDRLDLSGIVVTDIDYDIELPDASFALVTGLAGALATPVIASGVVKTLDDLATLRYLDAAAGVVVGRALHEGRFRLREALSLLRQDAGPRGERQSDAPGARSPAA